MPLPNVDGTTLLDLANLYFLPGDEELARPTPPSPPPHLRASSSSQPSSSFVFPYMHAIILSIQEEQASLLAYVQIEHTALHKFVQERHDELCGMIGSYNQYF